MHPTHVSEQHERSVLFAGCKLISNIFVEYAS